MAGRRTAAHSPADPTRSGKACKAHGTWKVRWRSKTKTAPAFRFPDPNHIRAERLSRRWGQVKLPKLGWVRFRWTRPLGGIIRNATVSKQAGRWYVSFCVEDGVTEVAPNGLPPVGVDRGVAVAVATSGGDLFDRGFSTPGERRRIRQLQRRLARSLRAYGRNRRSKRRDAVRAELGRVHARIRARRVDFAAQTANRLVRAHGLVAVEDLRVNPAYTSQTCNECGYVARENRESQAVFRCVACNHQDNADVNAAKNILAAGLAVTGRGDPAVGRSTKRQPPERLAV